MSYKTRHKGNGLCIRCFDKKRGKQPKRKLLKYQAHQKWWTRVKEKKAVDENFRFMMNKKVYDWQKSKPRLHRKNWKKTAMRKRFKNFITLNYKHKTQKGIEILIDGQRVKTPIRPPKGTEVDMDRVVIESTLFREIYKKVKEVSSPSI